MFSNKNLPKVILAIFSLYSLSFSWGKVGHQTVAYIAQKNLSPTTLSKIKPLLSAGETLVSISTWADDYKFKHDETAPWHYLNLAVRDNITKKSIPKFYGSEKDADIVRQTEIDIALLKSGKGSLKERKEALKYIVHFVGDLTMPLHIGDDNDRGGNDKQLRYFDPKSRNRKGHLHSIWDNLIEVKAEEDPAEYGEYLNGKITASERLQWQRGTPIDWAYDSYTIARSIYQDLPKGKSL